MLQLKNILRQLNGSDFKQISDNLKKSKADKFLALLTYYKDDSLPDEEIQKKLDLNPNAFYVLKSRLFDKVQHYLRESSQGALTDTFKKLVTIPNLVFNTEKSIAAAILTRLEEDLIENDMPNELTSVYSALKKIHLHSDKYYEYTQRYNKHVAYTLALNKAEDLLCDFTRRLGEYYASRNEQMLPIFSVLKKEMGNLNNLYKSHHLRVYQNILDVSCSLFFPETEITTEDRPAEDLLNETENILSQYPKDSGYQYLRFTLNFLFYEYYHKYKLLKKELQYFELINSQLPVFFYHNHTCFSSKFLVSKIQTSLDLRTQSELYDECTRLTKSYSPDKNDIPGYINHSKYAAASAFYAKKYAEAAKTLTSLINEIGFKHYPHAEIEIKLFLTLCYSMHNKYEVAWNIFRSVSRKITELNADGSYENAKTFAKLLNLQLGSNSGKENTSAKIHALWKQFTLLNQGDKQMLDFLRLDEKLTEQLAKPLK